MKISLFFSRQDNEPKEVEVTWEELAATLSEHDVREEKDGKAWSPTTFRGLRNKKNAGEIVAAVFDLDDCTASVLSTLAVSLDPYTYVMHSTFSDGCYRLVLPLAKPVPAADWPETWAAIRDALKIPADEACKDASRLYFLPAHPATGVGAVYDNDKKWLDVSTLARPVATPKVVEYVPEVSASSSGVDMFDIRTQLRKVRKAESAALVKLLLDGQSLEGGIGVNARMNQLAGIIAFRVEPIPEVDVAVELMRSCITATPDTATGNLSLRLEEFRSQYTRARAQAVKDRAVKAHGKELEATITRARAAREANDSEDDTVGSEDWKASLKMSINKDGVRFIRPTGSNVKLILSNDIEWKGFIRYNQLAKRIEVTGGPLENVDAGGWDIIARNWLETSKYRISVKKTDVGDQLWAVAWENSYDPLEDYLTGLRWDGMPRISTFFERYYGATASSPEYLTKVSEKFLLSCVARALDPGCKMETVVVLQGNQGVGKSKSLKALAGGFFSDEAVNIHDKDSKALASKFWIIELAELVSLRRSEAEAMKSFISRAEDTFRAPYARTNSTQPRRCVFVGTTNEDEYLKDVTGNRRFWPVKVSKVDNEALIRDRDQLWAEALVRYRTGEKFYFEAVDAHLAEAEAETVKALPARAESILMWWRKLAKRPEAVTGTDIALDALGLLKAQINRAVLTEIGVAMKALGFGKVQRMVDGVRLYYYTPPPLLATAPVKEASVTPIRKT